jgi:glycosyltransferase involved in cell wall biosynthesis
MKKLIIQIPCWNEELSIKQTIESIPRKFKSIESVEILVIDDGSSDNTIEEAQKAGADHIVRLPRHLGLAVAFQNGIKKALALGADIIVNTDADHQYESTDIEKLIQPILYEKADLVIGDRRASKLVYLPLWKRWLYQCADWVVSFLTRSKNPDPTSGFRAMSLDFAKTIEIQDRHSYTLETLIQARLTGFKVSFTPVRTQPVMRPSRLIQSTPIYIWKTTQSLIRSLLVYQGRYFAKEAK